MKIVHLVVEGIGWICVGCTVLVLGMVAFGALFPRDKNVHPVV